jgi:L-fucose isomerase-like protein
MKVSELKATTKEVRSLIPYIAVASLSSPLEVGADHALKAAEDLSRVLKDSGCNVLQVGTVGTPQQAVAAGKKSTENHVDAIAFVPVCWFEDYLILDLLEECNVPALFWPLPGMETGALCGTQQLTCYLKQMEYPFACVFGGIESKECLKSALAFLRAATLKNRLRRSCIGIVGHHINGMTHTSANEFMLKKTIGPRIVPLDLSELPERAKQMSEKEALKKWKKVVQSAGNSQVSEKKGSESMQMYAALKELIHEHRLDALTVGCYPHLMGRVCLAASLLADEGIPLACEGDVNGAVGQLMLTLLTNQPTHNTDWLEPLEDDTVIFTHCGSGSFSLAENKKDITLDTVRLMNRGVCALFPSRPGPVTLISLIAHPDGYQCALLEGEALSTKMVFPGNPLRVRFKQPVKGLIDWIFDQGIGHHWMIGYGHVAAEVRSWVTVVAGTINLIEP